MDARPESVLHLRWIARLNLLYEKSLPERSRPPVNTTDFAIRENLELYRWATQDPDAQVAVLAEIYRRLRPRCEARLLREDFSGNAADATAWVSRGRSRQALAVDIDAPTCQFAEQRAQRLIGTRAQRIQFVCDDVHAVMPPQVPAADIVSALNFSTFYFHRASTLTRYFEHARRALADDGILIVNAFGGPGAMRAHTDRHTITPRREPGQRKAMPVFDYLWQQCGYDACSGRIDCRIHFEVPDGANPGAMRRIDDAFRYEWRLWTLPELLQALRDAGFRRAQVWRHMLRDHRDGQRVFLGPVRSIREAETWVAYVVGIR